MGRKKQKKMIVLSIFISFLLVLSSLPVGAFNNVKKGDKALTFTANKIDGAPFSLDSILGKNAAVLFFWKLDLTRQVKEGEEAAGKAYDAGSKWIQEIDALKKMHDKFKSNGLEIIAITAPVKSIYDKQNNIVRNPDFTPEEINEIKKYITENGISFTVVIDEGLKIYNAYGIVPFPSTAFINTSGIVTFDLSSFPTFGGEKILEDNINIALGLTKVDASKPQKYEPKGKAATYYKNAIQFMDKDKVDKAFEELKLAIKEDPQYVDPHKIIVRIYEDKKDKENAMVEYITILELEPGNPLNHILYGDFSLQSGMIDDAKKEYELAIKGDTTGIKYTGRSGEERFRMRKIASGDAYYGLGMVALKEKKKDEAMEYFNKALGFFKGNTSEGDMFSEFSKAKEIHPNLPRVHYEIGMILLEKGEEDKAINSFKEGITVYQTIIKKLLKQ